MNVLFERPCASALEGWRRIAPTESPCEYIIRAQGCYGETLVNMCYSLIHFTAPDSLRYVSLLTIHRIRGLVSIASRGVSVVLS